MLAAGALVGNQGRLCLYSATPPSAPSQKKPFRTLNFPRAKMLGLNSLFPAAPGQYLVWPRGSILSPWLKLAKIWVFFWLCGAQWWLDSRLCGVGVYWWRKRLRWMVPLFASPLPHGFFPFILGCFRIGMEQESRQERLWKPVAVFNFYLHTIPSPSNISAHGVSQGRPQNLKVTLS